MSLTRRSAPSDALGATLVATAAVGFGTLGPLVRFAGAAGVEPLTLVAWRAGLGGLFVAAASVVLFRAGRAVARPWAEIPRRDLAFNLAAGITNAVLNLAAFVALTRISIALTLLVFYTYPALVALVSTTWFGERLDAVRWGALGISLLGLAFVLLGAGPVGDLDLVGVGLAFAAAVCQVFYAMAARHGFSQVPAPQAAGVTLTVALATYLVLAVVGGQLAGLGQPLASGAALWPVLAAGVVGAGIPTMAWVMGIRIVGPPRAAIISTLEPVVAVILAAALLAEVPTPLQILGGACIVAAAAVVQRRPLVRPAEHEAVA